MEEKSNKTIIIDKLPQGSVININNNWSDGELNVYNSDSKSKKDVNTAIARTKEECDKILCKALNAIAKKLEQFNDKMLWQDKDGRKMTNADLTGLFKRCFGVGSHPGIQSSHKQVAEQLCKQLIEKHNGCEPNEDGYVVVTVLNVLGYFKACGLLKGSDRIITETIIPFDRKLCTPEQYNKEIAIKARNMSRGRREVFDETTSDYLDYHIELLKQELKSRKLSKQ